MKLKKLKTNLPLMGETDINNWVQQIIENIHYADLKTLRDILNEVIQEHDYAVKFETIYKICDKCNMTYPEHTDMCARCSSTELRSFKIHTNKEDIERIKTKKLKI